MANTYTQIYIHVVFAVDPFLAPLMPYRLELMNGIELRAWLNKLTK